MREDQVCETFGMAVRQQRLALGLSQEGLAEASGLHRTYIGGIERGERNVTLRVGARLARALHMGLSDLLRDVR